MTARPHPPESLLHWNHPEFQSGGFVPEPLFGPWVQATFIAEDGPLHNEDHAHLAEAEIAGLWTNADNSRRGRTIVGTAELCPPVISAGKWLKARLECQLAEWFEDYPDFLITLDAGYAASVDDTTFCALVEHELYHCSQETDAFGMPKFSRDTGLPKWAMRGHDVEEFVGVVRRYGPAPDVQALVEAAKGAPEVAAADIAKGCGVCLARAA